MSQKRITLKDVAREAGVATGTVSMVLNDSPLVADATRARVQQVMRDLGYVYHRAAAHLRAKNSRIVGVSICDLVNPYYADVTAGIQAALEELGRILVLGHCAESVDRQMRFLETLREYNVEGLLLTPAIGTPKAHLARLKEWGLPVVQVTRYIQGVDTDYVGNDNRLAAQLAAGHLLGLGHERIAYVGLNRLTSTGRDRFAGFRAALKAAKRPVLDADVVECPSSREGGFRSVAGLFDRQHPPTAIVCFNDAIAFGVMLGLRRLGIEPGRDCSVVGLDDVAEAALWQPALTSVAIGRDAIGQAAGRLLMARLEEPDRPLERVVLPPQLVVRESCGAPPASVKPRKRA
jgi:LacI family transcriptional regulator